MYLAPGGGTVTAGGDRCKVGIDGGLSPVDGKRRGTIAGAASHGSGRAAEMAEPRDAMNDGSYKVA